MKEVYSAINHSKERQTITNREDQVHLARMRSGHHTSLMQYQNKLNAEVSSTCPRCNEGIDTIEHWLKECDAVARMKQMMFGKVKLDYDILTRCPKEVLALARMTFLKSSAPSE